MATQTPLVMSSRQRRRQAVDRIMTVAAYACTLTAVVVLGLVLTYVVIRGVGVWSPDFFTGLPELFGDGGGIKNALYGTLVIVGIATAIGVPVGMMTGIYLAEFGNGRLGGFIRFLADTMTGIPSIVAGIFMYGLLVTTMGFNAFAGSCALAILMIPVIARTTEETIRLVPSSIREASLALGVPQWKTTLRVVVPTALSGIITGTMLAVARVSGETAPLLFTALGNNFFNSNPFDGAMSTVSLYTYNASISPFKDVQDAAWGAALVLITIVLVMNLVARLVFERRRV